jgi:drug/metabolite transporter (DMT)-like permease
LQYSAVPFAALLGAVVFGETVSWLAYLGIGVVVVSLLGASWVRAWQDKSGARTR